MAQEARKAVARMNQINGQSFGVGADGQFNVNVPIDYNRRMDQVLEVHPESNVLKTPAPSKPYDNPLRRPPQR
jgi:hypothetical protein